MASRARPPFSFDSGNGALLPKSLPPTTKAEADQQVLPKVEKEGSRTGKKGVTFYLSPDAAKQLKILSVDLETSVQDLMVDAVDMLFAKHGRNRSARG